MKLGEFFDEYYNFDIYVIIKIKILKLKIKI